jgi:hypothetical protein
VPFKEENTRLDGILETKTSLNKLIFDHETLKPLDLIKPISFC